MGFALSHVDVGGGLGVDYDGSRSTRPASMNYSMREYANDVIYTVGAMCRAEGLPMPHIISESGRAITAHHALLLINVTDVESQIEPVPPKLGKGAHPLLVEMKENFESLSPDRLQEAHHDASFGKERAQELFASGVLSLRDRADVETVLSLHHERPGAHDRRRQGGVSRNRGRPGVHPDRPLLLQLLGLPVPA